MKLLLKYMGLLLFSGLIIPIYIIPVTKTCSRPVKPQMLVAAPVNKSAADHSFFYNNIVKNIFPVLKNLN